MKCMFREQEVPYPEEDISLYQTIANHYKTTETGRQSAVPFLFCLYAFLFFKWLLDDMYSCR